jgi:ribosomal protein L34
MPEISMRIDSGSFEALKRIRNHIDTFPNRIASAQYRAMLQSVSDLPTKLSRHGKAAWYLSYDIDTYGPVGMRLRIGPSKTDRKGKDGYSTRMATKVLLSGRRGGKKYSRAQGESYKLRKGSVQEGYPKFLKSFKLGKIPSKKNEIKKEARDIVLSNLMKEFRRQGFGARGGAQGIKADIREIRF